MSKLTIREIAFGSKEYEDAVRLRDEVLRKPLGLKFSAEELSKEGDSYHFAAFNDEKMVGCFILIPTSNLEMKMRQVAVSQQNQGTGVGTEMVKKAEAFVIEKKFSWIVLNARETAVKFYLSLGYQSFGEIFSEVGIPHQKMKKKLS